MTISHHYKMIFIHVQRTGGTSIISGLKKEIGAKVKVISQHGNAKYDDENILQKHNDYFCFGFVRNPWDRIFSWYSLLHKWNTLPLEQEIVRFEFFLINRLSKSEKEDPYFYFNQLDYFKNKEGKLLVQKIGRFENFINDFNDICSEIGLPSIQISKNNSTKVKNYRNYYSKRAENFISEICKEDIEYFSYSF